MTLGPGVRPFVRSELLIESNRISRGPFCTNFGQNSRFFLDKLGANFGWVLFVATVEWSDRLHLTITLMMNWRQICNHIYIAALWSVGN